MPPLADGRAVVTLVDEAAGFKTHHQQMLTPWILNNRSIFVTTYHMHEDTLNDGYTLVRSSEGNGPLAD